MDRPFDVMGSFSLEGKVALVTGAAYGIGSVSYTHLTLPTIA